LGKNNLPQNFAGNFKPLALFFFKEIPIKFPPEKIKGKFGRTPNFG